MVFNPMQPVRRRRQHGAIMPFRRVACRNGRVRVAWCRASSSRCRAPSQSAPSSRNNRDRQGSAGPRPPPGTRRTARAHPSDRPRRSGRDRAYGGTILRRGGSASANAPESIVSPAAEELKGENAQLRASLEGLERRIGNRARTTLNSSDRENIINGH